MSLNNNSLINRWQSWASSYNITVAQFCGLFKLDKKNFRLWLNGRRDSVSSRQAALKVINNDPELAIFYKKLNTKSKICALSLTDRCKDNQCLYNHEYNDIIKEHTENKNLAHTKILNFKNLKFLIFTLPEDNPKLVEFIYQYVRDKKEKDTFILSFKGFKSNFTNNDFYHEINTITSTRSTTIISLSAELNLMDYVIPKEIIFFIHSRHTDLMEIVLSLDRDRRCIRLKGDYQNKIREILTE